ncbi:MAG: hypothetical protein ACTIJJ_08330 [Galactobacter sp.]
MTQYPAFLRTYVPLAISAIVGWLATLGINVSDDAQAALAIGIGGVAWYTLIRWAEKRWPWLGALIRSAKTPDGYSKNTTDPYATQATPGKDGDEDGLTDDLDDETDRESTYTPRHSA